MPAVALPNFLSRARERLWGLRHSRRARKIAITLAVLFVVYALLGFFAAPAYLQHWIDTRAAGLLGRPVSVAALHFNPFNLKLGADQVHVGEADGKTPFVDIDQLTVNLSWSSLFRLAPVLDELTVQKPRILISRSDAQHFNFSDLIDRFASEPAKPDAQKSAVDKPTTDKPTTEDSTPEPARFSLSNITVHEGDIRFDDKVLNASHHVENIEIGIPFLSNLPHEAKIFVQPLLAMKVDGSPLRIQGQTKPFASSLESTIDFHLDKLDLPKYLSYVPADLPIAIPRGQLSGDLQLRFLEDKTAPQLNVGGLLVLDDFALADKGRVPIAEIGHASALLVDVQPLISRYWLDMVQIDQTTLHYTQQAGGRSNFDAFFASPAAKTTKAAPTEVAIANLAIAASRFIYTDNSTGSPAALTFDALKGSVGNLYTLNGPAATVDVTAQLNSGSVASRGKLDVPAGRYTGTLNLKDVGIAPLQPLIAPNIKANIQQGRLDTSGNFVADWHSVFNLHIEPATIELRDAAIGMRDGKDALLTWSALDVAITRFDLAAREAQHGDVVVHGLVLNAQRDRDGKFDLASLGDPAIAVAAPKPTTAAKAAGPVPAWRWSINRFALDDAALTLKDLSSRKPIVFEVKAIDGEIDGLSEHMQQPLKLGISGSVGKGGFEVLGQIKPEPLDADLKINTRELDIAGLQPYVEAPLNVRVNQAQLTSEGELHYVAGTPLKMTYRGRAALGRVRVQDKVSGDDFMRFNALNVGGIDLHLSEAPMRLKLGDIALSDFYARVIMNANGRLNLSDVAGSGAAQSVSVTRAEEISTPAPPTPEVAKPTTPATTTTTAPAKPAASIQIGQITLSRGQLNYTDNFIKPNYTANITQLTGKVGAFGNSGGAPADVSLQGKLDDNAQVTIDGKINPLAPVTFVDIKGKADGVELTHLSAYSSKYTGYPIEKGRLNADVSYLLDQGKLNADNHLIIDQLTFGDEIKDPGASHLPVKLAVALLKDSNGQINVNVPVSGSLDDPQFSIGGLVARAFGGLILKAATSPFRLLASAFKGGGDDAGKDLGYVEFAPGADALDATAKAKLDQIAKALADRPALHLGIIGRTDPSLDEAGLRQVMVDDLIRQEYASDRGENIDAVPAPLQPDDIERYLKAAYKHATFPKPKNVIGLNASQPPEEMRKLLEANVPTDDSAMLHLAERRAGHVVGYLHGKIDDARLWTLAPKLDAKGIDDQGKTTRVDFGLQ